MLPNIREALRSFQKTPCVGLGHYDFPNCILNPFLFSKAIVFVVYVRIGDHCNSINIQDNDIDICRLAVKYSLHVKGVATTLLGLGRSVFIERFCYILSILSANKRCVLVLLRKDFTVLLGAALQYICVYLVIRELRIANLYIETLLYIFLEKIMLLKLSKV